MAFEIVLTHQASIDIFEGIEWYNKQSSRLAKRFYQALQRHYKILGQNPYFQIRYADVRCLPVKKFPYMIHFIINEIDKQVVVLGVIHTHRDPKIWEERTGK